jgi:tetratricopeptide (TPR) repeat protein
MLTGVTILAAVLFGALQLDATILAADDRTNQTSAAPCSVNIAHVSGKVDVVTNCVDPQVVSFLKDIINRQTSELADKDRDIHLWIDRYLDLEKRLGTSQAFPELREEVKRSVKVGNFANAGTALEHIISAEESNVDQLAADNYDRAEMLVLELKPATAQPYYARAFRYRPENPMYAEGYARSLCDANQREEARIVYETSIRELRALVDRDPTKFTANLSCALINLAGLLYDNGDYSHARSAAGDALNVAKKIEPQNSKVAKENVANALTGLGAAEAKLGLLEDAKAKLLEAEELYSAIGVISNSRSSVFTVLADISAIEKNTVEQENKLVAAFNLEKGLTVQSPLQRRSMLAAAAHRLVEFFGSQGRIDNADSVCRDLDVVAGLVSSADQGTSTFLSATALQLRGWLYLRKDDLEQAKRALLDAIRDFQPIEGSLRTRESAMYSLTYSTLAWVYLREGEYQNALNYFNMAILANRDVDGAEQRRAASDKRIAQFFTNDFISAANDFLAHADDMAPFDKALWTFFVRKRVDVAATVGPLHAEGLDELARILMEVNNGRLPASTLAQAVHIIQQTQNHEMRCRLLFYIGESLLLADDRRNGLDALGRCASERGEHFFYPWVMEAEITKWSDRRHP